MQRLRYSDNCYMYIIIKENINTRKLIQQFFSRRKDAEYFKNKITQKGFNTDNWVIYKIQMNIIHESE